MLMFNCCLFFIVVFNLVINRFRIGLKFGDVCCTIPVDESKNGYYLSLKNWLPTVSTGNWSIILSQQFNILKTAMLQSQHKTVSCSLTIIILKRVWCWGHGFPLIYIVTQPTCKKKSLWYLKIDPYPPPHAEGTLGKSKSKSILCLAEAHIIRLEWHNIYKISRTKKQILKQYY